MLYSGANSPTELADRAAHIIKQRLDAGVLVTFTAVIIVDYSEPPLEIITNIESKNEIYKQQGVWERIDLRLKNQKPTLGIDVIIYEDKHVQFLITDPLRTRDIYKAVVIENRQDVAQAFIAWFDREVFPGSGKYDLEKDKLTGITSTNQLNNETDAKKSK